MTDATSADFAGVAQAVTGDWPQVVAAWEQFRVRHGLRLRADLGDTDQQGFLTEAFGAAYAKRRLDDLVALFDERGLVGPDFTERAAPFCSSTYAMQSMVNDVWRVQYVSSGVLGLIRARENVCRISVDGAHRGTGVLIKPNLVATAAHVVEPLVDAAGRSVADGIGRLVIHFCAGEAREDGDEDDEGPPLVARLHRNWLAHYSAPAPQENRGLSITSIAGIAAQGPWDLAIIQLNAPPAQGMGGYTRLSSTANPPSFGLHVLHHPADERGEPTPMLWSVGQVRQALGGPAPLRWLHDSNTSGGSSGAPCFDSDWRLVALHQAGPHRIRDPGQRNRAVPIHAWAPRIDGWAAATDAPRLSFVDEGEGRRTPVIGRRDLQDAVWRAMSVDGAGSGRAFVIRSEEPAGKVLAPAIVRALGRMAGHAVAAVDVRNSQADDAGAFAARLVGALAAELPADRVAPSGLTTALRDLRNDLAPALLAALGALAAGRQVWLVLHGWDDDAFPPSHPVRQVAELLLAGLDGAPGLHLVLTGWTGSPGAAFVETPGPPNAQEIADHALAALMPGGETAPAALSQVAVGLATMFLAQEPPGKPYARSVAVAERVRLMLGGLQAPPPAIGAVA